MKSDKNLPRGHADRLKGMSRSGSSPRPGTRSFDVSSCFAITFGLFLGLALLKFGNPVILESKISAPDSFGQFWSYAWPPEWSLWLLLPLVVVGGWLTIRSRVRWRVSRWLWMLPSAWFAWQLVSAKGSVDETLTATTLWQFGGCMACYFLGAFVLGERRRLQFLLIGLLAAFAFCLVRAVKQRLFEFPAERHFLVESQGQGWTNVPPEMFSEMKQDGIVIITNGMTVANPAILAKYGKEPPANSDQFHLLVHLLFASTPRVSGTLVYPNALAGAVLLLFPLSLLLAFKFTDRFRKLTRFMVIALTLFLGCVGLFWTGSKSGWLIALAVACLSLFRLEWSKNAKWVVLVFMLVTGLAAFGIRFQSYFRAGATSVGARFDYWRAAVQNTASHPLLGSGPGTFQRPYALLKSPDAEMARLTHNDYLEQFTDSGVIGGLCYLGWIILLMGHLGRLTRKTYDPLILGVFLGLLGWFIQGFDEFSLYIPALAWTAFTFGGSLLGLSGNQFDKAQAQR